MKRVFYLLLIILIVASCKKETTTLNPISINELYPLTVGKSFLYRLDSIVPIDFGKDLTKKSYLLKDSIESSFIDATGKKAFRIFRYITDTLQTKPWAFSATNIATIDTNKIEYQDNNLTFIKLANVVSLNTSWKGNSYINTQSPPFYYLDNWNYQYQNLNETYTCLKGNLQNTYTVLQVDEHTPGDFSKTNFYEKKYSIEVYAKGIGLIYKDFLYYIWQPGSQKYQDDAYGVRLNLIDYK